MKDASRGRYRGRGSRDNTGQAASNQGPGQSSRNAPSSLTGRAGEDRHTGAPSAFSLNWRTVAMVGAALAVCALLKTPTLNYSQSETDELIYWQLAENLSKGQPFSLQGTALLANLSPGIYDHPLFHHPPLFPSLLVPFVLFGSRSAAMVVPWLGHLLAVLAVALVALHAVRLRSRGTVGVALTAIVLPVIGICGDPLLVFVSRKLWVDSLLAGLVALSMAVLLVSDGRRRPGLMCSGALLGLAALTKLSALLVLPVFLAAIAFRRDETWPSRLRAVMAFALPVGVFVVPWCALFYLRCGVLVPPWVKPDAWLIENYPFVKAFVNRPWYYYTLKLPLLIPLAVVTAWALLGDRRLWADWRMRVAAAWLVLLMIAITYVGVDGFGFQMRQIAPAVTAVYVLLALLLAEGERPVLATASALAILFGTVSGAMYLLLPDQDEIFSLAEVVGVFQF